MSKLTLNVIANKIYSDKIDFAKIKTSLQNTLLSHNFTSDVEVNLHIISPNKIRQINKTWRQLDKPTDVLSFGQVRIPNQNPVVLGDIFVCYQVAKAQALEKNHSLQTEVDFLACHGIKHLIGIHHK